MIASSLRRWTFTTFCALASLFGAAQPAQAAKDFVYVHDRQTPNRIFGYQLKAGGKLNALPGSPYAVSAGDNGGVSGHGQTATYLANQRLVVATGTEGISVLRVAKSGVLTELPGSPFGPAGDYLGVATVRRGNSYFVYAAEFDQDRIRGFKLQANGSLTELPTSPFPAADQPVGLNSFGNLLFSASQDGTIGFYQVANTGALLAAPAPPVLAGASPYNVYHSPDGRYVYVPHANSGDQVYAFKVNAPGAALEPVAMSPFTSDVDTGTGAVVTDTYLFALAYLDDPVVAQDIQVFRRVSGGGLTKIAPRSSGLLGIRSGASKGNILILGGDNDELRTYIIGANGTLSIADTETPDVNRINEILVIRR